MERKLLETSDSEKEKEVEGKEKEETPVKKLPDSEKEKEVEGKEKEEIPVKKLPMSLLSKGKNKKTFTFQQINSKEYWEEVCRLICTRFDIGNNLTSAHYLTFEVNFEKNGGVKRKTPKPSIDAWCLVAGRVRECFDVRGFVKKYSFMEGQLQFVRRSLDIIEKKKLF